MEVLYLDDDPSLRLSFRERVEDQGGKAITAATNEEALRLLRQRKFDAFVSDWNLNPEARAGGPYAESAIREALGRGLLVVVRSGTDDSTGRLERLREEFEDQITVEEKWEEDDRGGIVLRGLPTQKNY